MGVGAGWYYDDITGDVVHQNFIESIPNAGFPYWHGPYPTEAAALQHKGVLGPTAGANKSLGQQAAGAVSGPIQNALFGNIGSGGIGNFFVRAAEGVVGIGLILIGVIALTKNTPAGKTVKKGVKAAGMATLL